MQSGSMTSTLSPGAGEPAASRSRRSRRSRASYRYDAKIKRYKYLLAGITLVFLVIFTLTWVYIAGRSRTHEQTLLELRKLEKALQAITGELESARSELDTLVRERIPGLQPLSYDEAINVDHELVRNIIFTMVKNGKKRNFEYRLVLHNDTLSVIRPEIEVLLFNDIGIQIGATRVDYTDATDDSARSALDPGEVRSYTSSIDLMRDENPRYFLLAVSEARQINSDRLREHLGGVISP